MTILNSIETIKPGLITAIFMFMLLNCSLGQVSQNKKIDISNLSFISGNWTTATEWGEMNENWSKPLGNAMMCAYQCAKNGKVVFYEFIVIEQNEMDIVMKLRHFNPGSIGWEEKEKPYELSLASLKENYAEFESLDKKTVLIFNRTSENKLMVVLQENKDAKREEFKFDYTLNK